MPKIKKLKRRKKFKVNINRKRLRNKLRKLPNIECKQIKESWCLKQSTISNLSQMGLAYDPNEILKVPSRKDEILTLMKENGEDVDLKQEKQPIKLRKTHVAKILEENAKYPRARLFRLPQNEVQFATYMIDNYGEDYKAMVKDRMNYNQLTSCQIKRKLDKFKSIPEQYAEYLVKKGEIVLEDPTPLKKLKPSILQEEIKPNPKRKKKKQKKSQLIKSIWEEENIDDNTLTYEKTDVEKGVEKGVEKDVEKDVSTNEVVTEKKLQLFPDEDKSNKDKSSNSKITSNISNTSDDESSDDFE